MTHTGRPTVRTLRRSGVALLLGGALVVAVAAAAPAAGAAKTTKRAVRKQAKKAKKALPV